MHIAIIDNDKCHFKKCRQECQYYCPPVRNGTMTVEFGEDGYPVIHEDICLGCGICAHRCPYQAIKIIGLPERQVGKEVHRYGENGFALYGIPSMEVKGVIGILGQNGTGKTTILNILTGNLIPNFARENTSKDEVVKKYKGTYLGKYLEDIYSGKSKISLKPQYVDLIPKYYSGTVQQLLSQYGEGVIEILEKLGMAGIENQDIKVLSGGELQSVAIAAALLKEADVYFFDEPSSYLDISQRLRVASIIRELAQRKKVIIVEHDLAILDFITDNIYLTYGESRAYGIVSNAYSTRQAINTYLEGFIKQENVKFRDYQIKFVKKPPEIDQSIAPLISWEEMHKGFDKFSLKVNPGALRHGQVVGVIGPNGTGKSTFVKMMAGEMKPDDYEFNMSLKTSYKPQSPPSEFNETVLEFLEREIGDRAGENDFKNEIMRPLNLETIGENLVSELSGGDLQKVHIAKTLGKPADLYVLDEPSAYLDSDQRMIVARMLKRFTENNKKTALVVDHDIYFIDLIATSLMVFNGERGKWGETYGPMNMKDGMNLFLKNINLTFRRDENTLRPRINKPDSRMDLEQKKAGEYYYY
ncbi:MAG: ribosome biogenesis/translation initiation ATPase RLI [Thermoplasmata archaeon]